MPIFIPDLFTGYINGRSAAIKDNWKDAENYNSVMKGQLENALTMQTMADEARKSNASANVADMNQTIAGARTDNELDLLNKQRARNLNDLKAQLEAIQTQFNIDLTKSDEYKKYMLGQLTGQTTVPTTVSTTGQNTVQTDQNNAGLVPQGTTQFRPENSRLWKTLGNLPNGANLQAQFLNYASGQTYGSQADLDAALTAFIAVVQNNITEQQNATKSNNMSSEELQEELIKQNRKQNNP